MWRGRDIVGVWRGRGIVEMWRGRGIVEVWWGRDTVGVWLTDGEEVWLVLESAIDALTSQLLMRLWYSTDVMMDSDPMML